ncbi:MAG: Clp protease ClpP [Alistipes sp.]|nr:Clp protease ClpP [Alistipes sp.]
MQTKITIRNEAQVCYIDIEGVIGVPEQNQFDNGSSSVATFEAFRREVERISEVAAAKVVVNIRSTGGDVNDALLIYDALQSLDAKITTRCYGYTASAATIIAQAADKGCREISSNALYLIHNSMCAIEGNAAALESRAELLRKTDERLAHLYAQHAGREAEEFAALMGENNGEGRWLSAEETIEAGLADKMIDNLITGAIIPEGDDDIIPDVVPEVVDKAKPREGQETGAKQEVKQALNRAAGVLLGYVLRRFSYRWEQWMESIRQKREERQRKAEAEPAPTNKPCDGEPVGGDNGLPQAAAKGASRKPSTLLFEEGQRRYQPTRVRPTEDPSVNHHHIGSNQSAYDEDARAFGRY